MVASATLFLPAHPSQAQETVPSLNVGALQPGADPNAGLAFEPAASPATGEFNVANWLSYGHRPVALYQGDQLSFKVIDHRLSGGFLANVGIAERVAVGVHLPYVLYQGGDDPTGNAAVNNSLGNYSLPTSALGDLAVLLKATLFKPAEEGTGGFSLAVRERLSLPTGDESSYRGEGHVVSDTRLLAEYDLLAFAAYASAGVRLRGEQGDIGCASALACTTQFGHELPFGLAVVVRPRAFGLDKRGRWHAFVETWGHVPLSPQSPFSNQAVSALQLGGGARYTFDNDLSLLAGVDGALIGSIGSPTVRGTFSLGWAPRKHDADGDGVTDLGDKDRCPDIKEDIDGFEDEDGCPDWDNDDDEVPDESDKCDGQQEDLDGFQDEDGCPDPDNDGDGIPDVLDHCPLVKGIASEEATQRGCPDLDPDRDGIKGKADRCFHTPEDKDGFEDEDGCPDPDNDKDGIADGDDACPNEAGAKLEGADNGCKDSDGDGIADRKDACPKEKGEASEDKAKNGCAPEEDEKTKKKKRWQRRRQPKKSPAVRKPSK